MRKFLFAALFCVLSIEGARAQQWNGVLAPSRAVDWSGAGVVGGIPERTTVCANLSPGVTAAQINSAIQSCPANQVVLLNPGTYNLTSGLIMKSGVVLRGSGANQTFLNFTGVSSCAGAWSAICFLGADSSTWSGSSLTQPGGSLYASWTGGYAKGSNQITLSSIGSSGVKVGTYLYLDQNNDTSTNGGFFQCDTTAASPACSMEGGAGNPGRVFGGVARQQVQIVKVTGCNPSCTNGATFTIDPSLHAPNWSASKNPAAWWSPQMIENAGLEDLSVDASNSGGQANVSLFNAANVWIRGTRQLRTCQCNRSIIQLAQSTHITVRDNYIYGTSGQSVNYGVESYVASDSLIMNNIVQHTVAPFMIHSNIGSVYAYNFTINNTYDDGGLPKYHWMSQGLGGHSSGVLYNLFEGNIVPGLSADYFHGNQVMLTSFRNLFLGSDPGRVDNTVSVRLNSWSRYMNFVGNILGTPGFSTTYEGTDQRGIYYLGAGGSNGAVSIPDDPLVKSTMVRWGNYDVVTAGSYPNGRFLSAEMPSGLSSYSNSVPANQSLPGSFFLSSRPSWWPAAKPWPPLGPDVTGGNLPNYNGHAHSIPAYDCYRNVMNGPADGSGAPLLFNRTACYSGSADPVAPGAPTNLRIQ